MSSRCPVSVVVPCYRCAGTIARAIDSIARQSSRPAEVILVDDASGDDTAAALEALRREHESEWIRIVPLDRNVGGGAARNAGWVQAREPLIAFLDADDAWHPEKLEVQYAFMRDHPGVALSGHLHRRLRADALPQTALGQVTTRTVSLLDLLIANRFVTPSVMLRRDLAIRFRPARRYMEDHLLWLEVAASGASIVRLEAVLAYSFKAAYGERGLSSNMWAMELGELDNYRTLHREAHLSSAALVACYGWSIAKYLVRRFLVRDRTAP